MPTLVWEDLGRPGDKEFEKNAPSDRQYLVDLPDRYIGSIELDDKNHSIISGYPLAENFLKDQFPDLFIGDHCSLERLRLRGLILGQRLHIKNLLELIDVIKPERDLRPNFVNGSIKITELNHPQKTEYGVPLKKLCDLGVVCLVLPDPFGHVRLINPREGNALVQSERGVIFLKRNNGPDSDQYIPIGYGDDFWAILKKPQLPSPLPPTCARTIDK